MNEEKAIKWSISAVLTYRICPRRYFLAQLLAEGRSKDPLRKQAYWLKKTINLDMWAGLLVDKAINQWIIPALQQKQLPDFLFVEEQALAMARRQFRFSEQGLYRQQSESKAGDSFCILDIHELKRPYESKDLTEVADRIKQAIRNFSKVTLPDGQLLIDWLLSADWLTPNIQNRHLRIGRADLNPQIDLLVGHQRRQIVLDWKVADSKVSDYARQLLICGTLIYRKRQEEGGWRYQHEDIQLIEVNLYRGYSREHRFTEEAYNETVDYVSLTVSDLEQLVGDRQAKQVPMHEFGFTESDYACDTCAFYHLCNHLHQHPDVFEPTDYAESLHLA